MDIESYGDFRRTTPHRLAVRRGIDHALRRAFDEAGVPWFDCRHENTGDGTFVLVPAQVPKGVFVEVLSTVLARELRRHNETHQPEEQIRLRMALHAGEVAYDDQGATGPAINRTFRLLEAPQLKAALAESPGVLALITSAWFFDEVVRSSTVVDALTFRPVRVAVKETVTTGWISLPDQPCLPHPGAAAPIPPRRPAAVDTYGSVTAQCTLPRDLPVFTGRAKELAVLAATVSTAAEKNALGVAIHVIDGMPGTGKTSFAVHAAYQLAAHFPDGQIFLELHGHSPSQAPVAPADALASLLLLRGVPTLAIPADLDDRALLWREKLAGKKVLLLLDDAVGEDQTRPLLPGGAGSLVLITSRHRLESIADAGRVSLQTLPAAEAAAMFDRYTFPEQHEPGAVAELMALCGNLPLAISLTAGRLRSHPGWTLRQLADDLSCSRNRLKTLRADNRSVAAAFELSYRDLKPDQQRLFRRLSLHPGSHIDAAAAAALDGNEVDATREQLEVLYLNHLLDEPSPGRYRLHDLTQSYGRSLTDPDVDDGAFERLLDYYLDTVRAANHFAVSPIPRLELGPQLPVPCRRFDTEGEAIAWLTAERATIGACIGSAADNRVRRAAELAAALHPFLEQHGHWHDAHRIHLAVLTAAQTAGDLAAEAVTRADLGRVQRLLGNYHEAAAILACARDLYVELGNQLGEADVLYEAGRVQLDLSNFPDATAYVRRAHQLYEELDNTLGVAATFAQLARVQYRSCDLEVAKKNAGRGLDLYRLLGNEPGEMSSLITVGGAQCMSGAYACAVDAFTHALSLSRKLGDRFAEAKALNNLGRTHFDCGNYGTADSYYSRAQIVYSQLDYRARVAVTLTNLGRLHHASGNHRLAFTYLTRAADLFGDDRGWQAENLNNLGGLALEWPEAGDPAELYSRALDLARAVGVRLQVGRALEGLGRSALKAADKAGGVDYLRRALALYQELAVPELTAVEATLDELADT
ncbi:tetratricopeptide repeat protein [Amycolatopsis sp. NPDC024027]|uniref:ATP-binding protein n=1 Tax=Amycolatopsis sp. NPDC024027 TaxID=3154327 RepID=UPI0033E64CDF